MIIIPPFLALIYISILARNVSFKNSTKFLYAPVFVLLALLPALQYGVGTDYFTYVKIIEFAEWGYYENKFEFLSVLLFRIAHYSGSPQLFFVLASSLNSILICIVLARLNRAGFAIYSTLILYIAVTSAYFNQLNLVRQYMAAHILVLMPFFAGKSNTKLFALAVIASMFHVPAALASALIAFALRVPLPSNISLFFLSPFLIGISTAVTTTIAIYVLPYLAVYNELQFEVSILNILTKLYYFPLVLALHPSVHRRTPLLNSRAGALGLRVWCVSYFLFIIPLFVPNDIIMRIIHYFMLFYIFPAIILACYVQRSRGIVIKFVFWLWVLIPLVIKVIVLPRHEYLYDWVL